MSDRRFTTTALLAFCLTLGAAGCGTDHCLDVFAQDAPYCFGVCHDTDPVCTSDGWLCRPDILTAAYQWDGETLCDRLDNQPHHFRYCIGQSAEDLYRRASDCSRCRY